MLILEQLLEVPESWVILPISIAAVLVKRNSARICNLLNGPTDRIIYLLTHPAHAFPRETSILLQEMQKVAEKYSEITWLYKEQKV